MESSIVNVASDPLDCEIHLAGRSLSPLVLLPGQGTCKTNPEAVRICDREVTQTVMAIGDRNADICPDFIRQRPVMVDVGNHHPDIG